MPGSPPSDPQATVHAATLTFPGLGAAPARAEVIDRSDRWRRIGALKELAVWWALALVVVWIPPHVPWVLVVLVVGALRARSRWVQRRTLVALHGTCPKCATEQEWTGGGSVPDRVRCVECKWELRLQV